MPGVCGVLPSSEPPGITLTPSCFHLVSWWALMLGPRLGNAAILAHVLPGLTSPTWPTRALPERLAARRAVEQPAGLEGDHQSGEPDRIEERNPADDLEREGAFAA